MELTRQIPHFLQLFLSNAKTAIPKGAQWVLLFDQIPVKLIKKIATGFEPESWQIDKALETLAGNEIWMRQKGCLFVQAVEIPGEGAIITPQGNQINGFLRTNIGQGREDYSAVQIVFLDTNISFADNVIRPWIITTAHLGMLARSGADNYRTNMTLYRLYTAKRGSIDATQKINFKGVCPVSLASEELNYTPETSPNLRSTTFAYHYYTMEYPTILRSSGN